MSGMARLGPFVCESSQMCRGCRTGLFIYCAVSYSYLHYLLHKLLRYMFCMSLTDAVLLGGWSAHGREASDKDM